MEPTEDKQNPKEEQAQPQEKGEPPKPDTCYTIQFRPSEQLFSAVSVIKNLNLCEVVMAQTDHGLEPATIHAKGCPCPKREEPEGKGTYTLVRRGTRDEVEKFTRLIGREKEAFDVCQRLIEKHQLPMKLIKVERFFNGSKIIFYFTAENRVDFRELVKDLVQEFRTRVEIRQIGVRHETKMLGGLGCCGRELCCSSFIKNFAPVSIKMAKEQGLPLNPSKISGICNRLLCCLTYEFDTYHSLRKNMPKQGKSITLDGRTYKVLKQNILNETINVIATDEKDKPFVMEKQDWQRAKPAHPPQQKKGEGGHNTKKSHKTNKPPEKKGEGHDKK